LFPPLYAILDPNLASSPLELAQALAEAGIQLIQLRHKNGTSKQIYSAAKRMTALLQPRGVRLIVNDRPDIAAITGAAGTHVGQEDLPVEQARRICRVPAWVGVSTHTLDQVREADRTSADYIAVGPIFPTETKENPDPIVGIRFVHAARQLTRKPLVAIGGIRLEFAEDLYRAGADSVAVVRDILTAQNPPGRVREYLAVAERTMRL
jgi:thiamine-phosphate pyrophosphorylase